MILTQVCGKIQIQVAFVNCVYKVNSVKTKKLQTTSFYFTLNHEILIFLNILNNFRAEKTLLDVSLVCADGKSLLAHKLVLSACSAVFKRMLTCNGAKAREPTILLYDIRAEEMEALVEFMYNGEVNITQDKLNHFLDLAEKLQVRGLTSDAPQGGASPSKKRTLPSSSQQSLLRKNPVLQTPVTKKVILLTLIIHFNIKVTQSSQVAI